MSSRTTVVAPRGVCQPCCVEPAALRKFGLLVAEPRAETAQHLARQPGFVVDAPDAGDQVVDAAAAAYAARRRGQCPASARSAPLEIERGSGCGQHVDDVAVALLAQTAAMRHRPEVVPRKRSGPRRTGSRHRAPGPDPACAWSLPVHRPHSRISERLLHGYHVAPGLCRAVACNAERIELAKSSQDALQSRSGHLPRSVLSCPRPACRSCRHPRSRP